MTPSLPTNQTKGSATGADVCITGTTHAAFDELESGSFDDDLATTL